MQLVTIANSGNPANSGQKTDSLAIFSFTSIRFNISPSWWHFSAIRICNPCVNVPLPIKLKLRECFLAKSTIKFSIKWKKWKLCYKSNHISKFWLSIATLLNVNNFTFSLWSTICMVGCVLRHVKLHCAHHLIYLSHQKQPSSQKSTLTRKWPVSLRLLHWLFYCEKWFFMDCQHFLRVRHQEM